MALQPFDIVGVPALRKLFVSQVTQTSANADEAPVIDLPALAALIDDIAADGHGLVMLMGKGGVGKTTIAAAVAVALAHRGLPVHLTTSDPAAHLTQTLADSVSGLTVSRIDPLAETERYCREALSTKGAKLDAQGRALLEEDLRSPARRRSRCFRRSRAFSKAASGLS